MDGADDTDIMNLLDYPLMEKIYKDYMLIGGQNGLDIDQFVKVMLHYLVKPAGDESPEQL